MRRKLILFTVLFCNGLLQFNCLAQVDSLNFFINQGLAHSPVLKDLSNRINSNTLDSLLVKAGKKPQVNYNSGLYYAPIIQGIGYSEPLSNISSISSVVSVSQRIFNQKILSAQYSKYAIQGQALKISSRITESDLKKAITLQYLTVCSVSNDLSFNHELLNASNDEELILKQLVDKGLYRQVDYYSFMVELKAQELLVNDLQIQYRKEISSLYAICGLSDTALRQVSLPEMKLIPPANEVTSPFFTRFIVDSIRIQNEKSLVDQNYKPMVNWFSDAGLWSNKPQEIDKNFGFSFGLSLSVPIFDGNQRKLNYEKLKIAENTRKDYAGYFKQQYDQQLQQLYAELKSTREIIPEVNRQLGFADLIVKQNTYLLSAGNISITDYVTALKNYISIKHSLNQYQVRILQIITEINYWNQ